MRTCLRVLVSSGAAAVLVFDEILTFCPRKVGWAAKRSFVPPAELPKGSGLVVEVLGSGSSLAVDALWGFHS